MTLPIGFGSSWLLGNDKQPIPIVADSSDSLLFLRTYDGKRWLIELREVRVGEPIQRMYRGQVHQQINMTGCRDLLRSWYLPLESKYPAMGEEVELWLIIMHYPGL